MLKHWPTVAPATDVTPGVFTGEQVPEAGGLLNAPMNELAHWYTVAGSTGLDGVPLNWLVMVAVQMTVPPGPREALHCWTVVTGEVETDVLLMQVPPPEAITAAVPTHRSTVTVEGGDAASVPAGVR